MKYMIKHVSWLISLFMLIVIQSACSQSNSNNSSSNNAGNNTSNLTSDSLSNRQFAASNFAMIKLVPVITDDPSIRPFPISDRDSIWLPIATANSSSGSYTSIRFYFEKVETNQSIGLEVFLPSAPKFKLIPNRSGTISLDIPSFPYTLSGADYIPFSNALFDTPIKARIHLSVSNKSKRSIEYLTFDIEEMTINAFSCENNLMNAEFAIYLITDEATIKQYGMYTARLQCSVKNFQSSVMMVD